MAKKRYSPEQIIQSLREVEIHTSEGKTIAQSVRHIGVTKQTYYRWRKIMVDSAQARRNVLKNWKRKTAGLSVWWQIFH